MNRRTFEAIKKQLGDRIPQRVHSLPELAIWLRNESGTDVVREADLKILEVLEREGMFVWYMAFSTETRLITWALKFAADAAEVAAPEEFTTESMTWLAILRESIPMLDASVARRRQTAQDYEESADVAALKTFQHFRSLYSRQYEDATQLHQEAMRLIEVLSRRCGESD